PRSAPPGIGLDEKPGGRRDVEDRARPALGNHLVQTLSKIVTQLELVVEIGCISRKRCVPADIRFLLQTWKDRSGLKVCPIPLRLLIEERVAEGEFRDPSRAHVLQLAIPGRS